MIEAIGAMAGILADLQSLASAATAPLPSQPTLDNAAGVVPAAPSFSQMLHTAIGQVDGTIASANSAAKNFAAGDQNIPLSDVMVSLEQANLALQMASGVRDKVVAAYATVMNMQI
jgi:flagellar hook-basal body complex protein FliE